MITDEMLEKAAAELAEAINISLPAPEAPQKILCKRFSTKARISHVCCA